MKFPVLLISSLLSFSVLATVTEQRLVKQSFGQINTATIKSQTQTKQASEKGKVSLQRRSQPKQKRLAIDQIAKQSVDNKSSQKKRDLSPIKSSKSAWFDIQDAWLSLDADYDYDGYFSEFSLNFNADTSDGYVDVYAEVYTRSNGTDWLLLHATDDFTIYSTDVNDFYSVEFGLNVDFPTDHYDILIDLFEVGYAGIVATLSSDDDYDLYQLPLEDNRYEVVSDATAITFVAADLYTDRDRDGHYTQLTLEYDIDTQIAGRNVYAEIEIFDTQTAELRSISTGNFTLANQTEFIDIDFESGYFASYYDLDILLIDVITGEVLESTAQSFDSLIDLPIESVENDYYESHVDVHVSGGGSLGLISGLFLLFIATRRRLIS